LYIKELHNSVRKNKPTRIEKRDMQTMWDKKELHKNNLCGPQSEETVLELDDGKIINYLPRKDKR
jgi:hypothetical protein